MLVIQIGLSGMDYLTFKTVPTIHKDTLLDILFPRIIICHKEVFNIGNPELRELITGMKENRDTNIPAIVMKSVTLSQCP